MACCWLRFRRLSRWFCINGIAKQVCPCRLSGLCYVLVLPLLTAIVMVHKIGNKGRSVTKMESVILKYPSAVCNGFLFSTASGLGVAILAALLLGIESSHLFMAIAVLLPIALFLLLVQANVIQSSTLQSAFKYSLSIAIGLLLVSFLMGPYFIVGLPVVLYGLVASFVFLYVIYNHQKT